ncbi:hypothetical protein D3C84_891920 [compost metagenome]
MTTLKIHFSPLIQKSKQNTLESVLINFATRGPNFQLGASIIMFKLRYVNIFYIKVKEQHAGTLTKSYLNLFSIQ